MEMEAPFDGLLAVLVSRVSRLCRSTLACACTPLCKSGEKERLLAVYERSKFLFPLNHEARMKYRIISGADN